MSWCICQYYIAWWQALYTFGSCRLRAEKEKERRNMDFRSSTYYNKNTTPNKVCQLVMVGGRSEWTGEVFALFSPSPPHTHVRACVLWISLYPNVASPFAWKRFTLKSYGCFYFKKEMSQFSRVELAPGNYGSGLGYCAIVLTRLTSSSSMFVC